MISGKYQDKFHLFKSAVVIHDFSFRSKAFNLSESPAVWQVILGDDDRSKFDGNEVISEVELIIMHGEFHNYQHDIGKH